jgi:hypothetical protein
MNAPFPIADLAICKRSDYFDPEKLAALKRVFEIACTEAASPDALSQRTELAERLLTVGATIVSTPEYESLLLAAARIAIANHEHAKQETKSSG